MLSKIQEFNFTSKYFSLYFFGLWGAQILILFLYILSFSEYSQTFTIPYRLFVVFISLVIFLQNKLIIKICSRTTLKIIFLFYLFVLIRIISDTFLFPKNLGTPGMTYFFRFGSMIIIPSLAFALTMDDITAIKAKNGVRYSCIIFLILGFYLYRGALGVDYRSLHHISNWDIENLISPMAFSYIGLTLAGIVVWEMFYRKKISFINILTLLLALFAMVWSGTRNAIVALTAVLLFTTLQQTKNIRSLAKVLMFWLISITGVIYFLQYSGSMILFRFLSLFEELSHGDKDAGSYRLGIWQRGWEQFSSNPFLGSGIEEEGVKYVAHNMYLESLMSTGIIGSILFLIILIFTFINGNRLLKNNSSLGWLMILFLERIFTGMMSTSILDPLFWLPVIAINSNSTKIK